MKNKNQMKQRNTKQNMKIEFLENKEPQQWLVYISNVYCTPTILQMIRILNATMLLDHMKRRKINKEYLT